MPESEEAEDHAYFRALEDTFIRLRGAPLLLSPGDWQVAREWRRQGVPQALVERTLEEVFARRAERDPKRPVTGLRYCARAVAAAWEDVQELQATDDRSPRPESQAGPPIVARRLETLGETLEALGEEALARGERDRLATRLRKLAARAEGAEPEAVEEELGALDRQLVAAAADHLAARARESLEGELEATLAKLRGRLAADEVERSRDRLRTQLLRERLGLPVLSLFVS